MENTAVSKERTVQTETATVTGIVDYRNQRI